MPLTIKELQKAAGIHAKEKGFHTATANIGELLMLICTEAAEAMEDYRNHNTATGLGTAGYDLDDLVFQDSMGKLHVMQKSASEITERVKALEESGSLTDLAEASVRKLYKPIGFP